MKTIFLNILLKLKLSMLPIFSVLLAFIVPIKPLMLIVGFSIFIDTIFGIVKARKLKQKVISKKLSRIVSKMVLYELAILLFFCIEKYIIGDFIGLITSIPLILTKIVTATLVTIEIVSINENYEVISGVNIWSKFKSFLMKGKELKEDIKDIVDPNK